MPQSYEAPSTAPAWVDASTPGAAPVYGGKTGGILLGYQVPDSYTQAQNIAAATAANLAAGPSSPGMIWVDQPSQADIAHGNATLQPGRWVTPGPTGVLNQLAGMANDLKPIILAVASGGAFGAEGILASKIINAGSAIQSGNTLGGLSQLAGIADMTNTATALRIGQAIQNNDLTSLATGALRNTDIGRTIGSTELGADLNVNGALNLVSAVTGLGSTNPRTVINSIVDLQDRVPDLVSSVVANNTGGGGLDTVIDAMDTLTGGAGNDFVTGGAGNDSVTGGGGLDTVTVSGSNGTTGTDVIDDVLSNLGTTRSLGGTPTTLNNVTVSGTCPTGQVRNPLTGKCEDITNILSGVNVTGTQDVSNNVLNKVTVAGQCPAGQHKDPVTGKCVPDTGALDTVTVAGQCPAGQHKDPVTGACVPDTGGLDTVTVTGTCPVGQHKDPITGACVPDTGGLDTVTVTGTCPAGQHKDPITGACVPDTVVDDSCPSGQHRDASGKCVPDELKKVTVVGECPVGQHKDILTGACVDDVVVNNECPAGQHRDAFGKCVPDVVDTSCPVGQHRDAATGKCVPDTVVDTSCPAGQVRDPVTGKCVTPLDTVVVTGTCLPGEHKDPITGACVPDTVVDTSCPVGQHRDPATGQCVPDTVVKPPVVTPPVVTPPVVTPAPAGALPTYSDAAGIPGKVLTLGKMGNLMRYEEGLKQLDVPTEQHWADMPDLALPTADVNKAQSALARYAPDAERDVIPQFYAHGGTVQHFADGGMPDVQAMLAAADKADVMDALKNLGNIGSGLEPLKPKMLQMGQMGAASQQKPLQQMSVIPQLAALLQSRGMHLAEGGRADHEHPEYDGTPVFRTGGLDGLGGKYVEGKGDGTSDDITAMLANGEYVFSADVVSALGNGSNKAGAKELDHMVQAIRARARSAPPDKLPPDAKSPLEYLKSSKGSKHG